MNILAPQADTPKVEARLASHHFHVFMACSCLVILTISVLGCWVTSIHVFGLGARVVVLLAVVSMFMPVPVYWHEKGRTALRDASLTIPWAVLLALLLPFPILIGARLRMPLHDALFAHIDQSLGVSVPEIMVWVRGHWIGQVLARSYYLLTPLLLAAIFVPALAGKVRQAKEFVVANLFAFAIAIPTFTLFPAVGPWYFYGFSPRPSQRYCEMQLLALRLPGDYSLLWQGSGIVCFPSFHVFWAVLCASVLWGFRPLRVPISTLSLMIILSTLTTGWHYFIDVLGGLVLAAISLTLAKLFVQYDGVRRGRMTERSGIGDAMYTDVSSWMTPYTDVHIRERRKPRK